jgi:uncharacterized membrane protein
MGFLSRLVRTDYPEDPKRLVLILAALGLIGGFLALAIPAALRIYRTGDLGGGAVAALIGAGGPLAGLAGYAHKKPDDPIQGGDQ